MKKWWKTFREHNDKQTNCLKSKIIYYNLSLFYAPQARSVRLVTWWVVPEWLNVLSSFEKSSMQQPNKNDQWILKRSSFGRHGRRFCARHSTAIQDISSADPGHGRATIAQLYNFGNGTLFTWWPANPLHKGAFWRDHVRCRYFDSRYF